MSGRMVWGGIVATVAIMTSQLSPVIWDLQADSPNSKQDGPKLAREERESDSEQISIEAANRFHAALVWRMMLKMPAELNLSLQYEGIIGFDQGKKGGARGPGFGRPLNWNVSRSGVVIFNLAISTRRSPQTHAACQIGKDTVFVSVGGILKDREVNQLALEKRQETLGGRSILEFIKLLESPPGEAEEFGSR